MPWAPGQEEIIFDALDRYDEALLGQRRAPEATTLRRPFGTGENGDGLGKWREHGMNWRIFYMNFHGF